MTTGQVNVHASSAYQQSFGHIPSGTVYQQVGDQTLKGQLPNIDMREQIGKFAAEGMKAFTTSAGGAGTAGNAMIPVYVDPQIIDLTRKQTPLVEIIPRVTNLGLTADYNEITAKGGAVSAAEDAALSETNTTYNRQSKSIKYLYAVGRVTGPAQAAVPSYVLQGMNPQGGDVGRFQDQNALTAMQQEVLVKTREIRELEESLIVNGNSSSDSTQFDGIVQQLGATNTVDKNTTALSLDDVNTAVQNAFDDGGLPNLAVCSSAVYTDLLNLLTAKIGYLQATQQVFWGFSTVVLNTAVGQIPVIQSRYLSNSSGSKAMYFLDLSVVQMRVLQDLTYEELAKTNDSQKFMLKIYEALVIKAPTFCASITEIA